MPRGKLNNQNSFMMATPEDPKKAGQILGAMLSTWNRPEIDTKDPEQVSQRITDYFHDCMEKSLRPGIQGLLCSLGIRYQDYCHNSAAIKGQTSAESLRIIKKAHMFITSYLEQIGSQGLLSPPVLIFWQKNYCGLTDAQQVEIIPKSDLTASQTLEQIEESIPLDMEEEQPEKPS